MDVNFISPFPREPLHQQMVLKPGHTPAHEPREGRVVPRHGGWGGGYRGKRVFNNIFEQYNATTKDLTLETSRQFN